MIKIVVPTLKATATPPPMNPMSPNPTISGSRSLLSSIVRPALPPIADQIPSLPSLDLRPPQSPRSIESALQARPATARSSSILSCLPGLTQDDPTASLDQILSILRVLPAPDSRVIHLLSQSLFVLIQELLESPQRDARLFKCLAIGLIAMPGSTEVLAVLEQLSESRLNDHLFAVEGISERLTELAFSDRAGVQRRAAAILRRISGNNTIARSLFRGGIFRMLARALQPEALMQSPVQFVRLLAPLISCLDDFTEFVSLGILPFLLRLIHTFPKDAELHHAIANCLALLFQHTDAPEVFQQFELPLFLQLLSSDVCEVVQASGIALAAALERSVSVVRGVVELGGVPHICAAVEKASIEGKVALMSCVLKLTESAIGIEAVKAQLQRIVHIAGIHIGELAVWSPEQSFLITTILTLDAIARTDPALVADCLGRGLQPFLHYCVFDYTIDLVTVLVGAGVGADIMKEISSVSRRRK
jgi:hypothetical protein